MKKKSIFVLILVGLLIVIGVYYQLTKNDYPELSADVIQMIGGQEVADKLIANFEESRTNLNAAISDYKLSDLTEDKKPTIELFIKFARDAQYLRKYDLAVKTLESVFDYYDKSDIALINLAHVYEDMKEYQKAIDTYLRFYDTFGVQIQQLHLDIIRDYMALDDRENVIKYYDEFKKEGFASEEVEQYIAAP
jgi:tetratricopeptide (TPR) repeat protein